EGDWDFEFYEELAPLPGEKVFVKKVNSCFSNKELCKYLEEKGEETVIIAGLQTNYCIDASIKSAFDRDYGVIVPEGCNSTFDNDYMDGETTVRYYNEDIWDSFADVVPIEEAFEVEE
ncbi:MAG: isochorismatase family protein, partial [Lachnospiraceae bacterium]|nr:isochorismatase family protein [Lachnospiraceae bacterium]